MTDTNDAQADDCKAFATLAARFAIEGFTLTRTASGTYLIGRWQFTRELADIAAVEQFLTRVQRLTF